MEDVIYAEEYDLFYAEKKTNVKLIVHKSPFCNGHQPYLHIFQAAKELRFTSRGSSYAKRDYVFDRRLMVRETVRPKFPEISGPSQIPRAAV